MGSPKVALLTRQYGVPGYLVSAAPRASWKTAIGADLFGTGTIASADLFKLRFPAGRPLWDWLLEGGYGRYPNRVPREIATREVTRALVQSPQTVWEVRAAAISAAPGSSDLELRDGWPEGKRPEGTTYSQHLASP